MIGTYTRASVFHPNYWGIALAVVIAVVLIATAIYLVRRFANRNAKPS